MSEINSGVKAVFDLHEHIPTQTPVVLEVGPCYSPSVKEEGAQFFQDYPEAVYVAADLPQSIADLKRRSVERIISANSHALPFGDESIDLIVMKSVFGQFTGRGESDIEDIRTFGMLEYSRVLMPGGIALIFEENTPWYRDYIESYARDVSLEVIDTVYKFDSWDQEQPNASWEALRKMFYATDTDIYTGKGWGDKDFPKCIILQKPNQVVYRDVEYDVVINSHRLAEQYCLSSSDNDPRIEPKWQALTFKTIVDELEEDDFER